MVVVHGLVGNIVAEKNRQLLVCSLKEEQRIKESWKFKKQYTMRKKHSKLEFLAYLITFIGFLVIIVFVICLCSNYRIGGHLSDAEMAITGQVGDFMGGVIGSIWALAGVFLYFSAIKMQNKELENQSKYRREDSILDSIKSFENTFFSLLTSQQRIKDELCADFSDVKYDNHKLSENLIHASGNVFFDEAYIVLRKLYSFCERDSFRINLNPNKELPYATNKEDRERVITTYSEDLVVANMGLAEFHFKKVKEKVDELDKCKAIYFLFSMYYSSTIGHYCRHLYNIMKYMDQVQLDILVMVRNNFEGRECVMKMLDVSKRFKRYAAFLQSGLSSSEMCILYYNSLLYPKAKKLYLRYKLLENLQDIYLIKTEHKNLVKGFKCTSSDKMIENILM